jgi:hypothetical protein
MEAALGLATTQVAELCRRRPTCLMVPSITVVAVVEAVRVELGVDMEVAAQLCVGRPSVFEASPAAIAATSGALKQHIGLQGMGLERCMVRMSGGDPLASLIIEAPCLARCRCSHAQFAC